MILVDTSVWVDHLNGIDTRLGELLNDNLVVMHPFVIGELSCGNLRRRDLLSDLGMLPNAVKARHDEVARFVEDRELWGKGISWIDAHLLASAILSECLLWTFDKALARAAAALHVGHR